jgi:copper homeostasis protein
MGLDGIVSGVLRPNFTLDRTRTKELVELSGAMAFTFHRAFDWVKSPISTLEQLETLGVNYLLTSGQQNSVNEGMPLLKLLHKNARTCKIMPGGGVDENNTAEFKKNGFSAIHLSGTEFHKTLPEPPKVSMNSEKFLKEDMIALTGVERVAKIMKMVK